MFKFHNFGVFLQKCFNITGKEGVTPVEVSPRASQNLEKDAAVGFAKKSYERKFCLVAWL